MKKVLRIDPLGGASGDMFLAALVDLGADIKGIESELSKLDFEESFQIKVERTVNRGFAGTRLKVQLREGDEWVAPESQHTHGHDHHGGHHHGRHRHLADIYRILDKSELSQGVKERAKNVFAILAESEGKVHGKKPEEVHFHEVGAVDSMVDIIGSCLALENLGVGIMYVTAVGLAQGSVKCAHGVLPLPAPATQLMLEGCPVVYHTEEKELCTPTGAALLKALGNFTSPVGVMRSKGVGMGLSHRTPHSAPPFLRMTLLERDEDELGDELQQDTVVRLSFDIDDMSPEYLAPITSELMNLGALDVASSSLNMKKGRLGCEVRVLCTLEFKEKMLETILKQSSTFGVRVERIERVKLDREIIQVKTRWGQVGVKRSLSKTYPKEHIEMEDVMAIARKEGMRVEEVFDKVKEILRG